MCGLPAPLDVGAALDVGEQVNRAKAVASSADEEALDTARPAPPNVPDHSGPG